MVIVLVYAFDIEVEDLNQVFCVEVGIFVEAVGLEEPLRDGSELVDGSRFEVLLHHKLVKRELKEAFLLELALPLAIGDLLPAQKLDTLKELKVL